LAHDNPDAAQDAAGETGPETGLRERKKARRRQEIVDAAARLFASRGIDATSLADIAHETGVSPPTVANYFGAKENILSTLIFDGTQLERIAHIRMPRKTGGSFGTVLGDLLCECSENTMRVAGKRVWRYVEATSIRRPGTDLQERLAYTDAELRKLIAAVLNDYAMVLRSGAAPDAGFIAQLLFDRWTSRYFAYIKDDAMLLETHKSLLRADMKALVSLVFDDAFAATSPLKPKGAAT
jgi:AcrR family transcriptional regulator